jgi:hypothetical protein
LNVAVPLRFAATVIEYPLNGLKNWDIISTLGMQGWGYWRSAGHE